MNFLKEHWEMISSFSGLLFGGGIVFSKVNDVQDKQKQYEQKHDQILEKLGVLEQNTATLLERTKHL